MIDRQKHLLRYMRGLVSGVLMALSTTVVAEDSGVHRDNWYLQQTGEAATIQLSGHKSEADAREYITSHNLVGDVGFFSTRFNGEPWFAVTYGSYDSLDAARLGLKQLPEALRRHSPWPRSAGPRACPSR